ncbi:MBL fold metallo-hydrolase [bacterium]|nr:MBL fold metallo-hydrolase [bacterium]
MELFVMGKYGPYGKAGVGAASGYLITEKNTSLLLDMGSGVLSRLIDKIDVRKLDAIYISHLHYDHTSDLLPFRYLLEELDHKMTIYTHKEDSPWYNILFDHPLFKVVAIDENTDIKLKDLSLSFYIMDHPIANYAIKIKGEEKTFLYTGDTRYCENIFTALRGVDCALADCSKPNVFIGGHMTADKAIEIHKKTGVRIIATHLSPYFSPENLFKDYEKIEVAQEFKTYTI